MEGPGPVAFRQDDHPALPASLRGDCGTGPNGLLFPADETRYYVVDLSRSHQWAWVTLTLNSALYILDPSRSSRVPLDHFSGRSGILLVDRYGAYKATTRQLEGLRRTFWWAHVRRDFLNASVMRPKLASWAHQWTHRIGALFHETETMRDGTLSAGKSVWKIPSKMERVARTERWSRRLLDRGPSSSFLKKWTQTLGLGHALD